MNARIRSLGIAFLLGVLTITLLMILAPNVPMLVRSRIISTEAVLDLFYRYGSEGEAAEDMLIDPLILAGDRIVLGVVAEVRSRQMPKRLYAISFLSNGRYREALPILKEIALSSNEESFFRSEALGAILCIDPQLGEQLSAQIAESTQRTKIVREPDCTRRTFVDALRGLHE